jgi:hypothetical protein
METPMEKKEDFLDNLLLKRDEALERVVDIWLTEERDPEELNKVLDVLAVAHATATFEFASGSFSS